MKCTSKKVTKKIQQNLLPYLPSEVLEPNFQSYCLCNFTYHKLKKLSKGAVTEEVKPLMTVTLYFHYMVDFFYTASITKLW